MNPKVRFIALSAAAGTFITFGLSPLQPMPVARADGEDVIIDQIINSLSAVDPTAALDMSGWLSSLDAALQGAANFDPSSLAGGLPDIGVTPDLDPASAAALPAALSAAEPPDSTTGADLYQQWFYDPAHAWDQSWIAGTTFLGPLTAQWDNALNTFWGDIGGQGELIGNGADGTARIPPAAPAVCGSATAALVGTAPWPVRLRLRWHRVRRQRRRGR